MQSLHMFISRYRAYGRNLRVGQYFCDCYIKSSWPELYYEEDESKALKMIEAYLSSHHYFDSLPKMHPAMQESMARIDSELPLQ